MSKNPTLSLKKTLSKIEKTIKESINAKALKPVAEFTIGIVVKRTRLGYGVEKELGERSKFTALSKRYVEDRKVFKGLASTTTAKRSNLTRTGEMLESMEYKVERGEITIFPSRRARKGSSGLTNYDLAGYHAKGNSKLPRRVFNNVSSKEFNQILRFYRKTFGDLLRLRGLIS